MRLWLGIFAILISLSGCYNRQSGHRISEQLIYDENENLTMRIMYQYDSKGNLIKNIGYDNNNIDIFFSEYVYNSDGLLEKSINKYNIYLNGIMSGEYDSITTYEYNADNQMIKSLGLLKNGDITEYTLFTLEDDRIIMIENHDADNNIIGTIFFEYDNNGKRINTQNEENKIISYREYNDNNLLETVEFNNGSKRIFIWENGTTTYDHDMYFWY